MNWRIGKRSERMQHKFKTNLNCGNCVAAVTQLLNSETSITHWSVDTADPQKVLTVEGEAVAPARVEQLVAEAGFKVLGQIEGSPPPAQPPAQTASFVTTYRPLLLILTYLIGLVALVEFNVGDFQPARAMRHFMGGFFIAFSFFKLLDLRGFADAFQSYDVLARQFPVFGRVYPFIELTLGIAYLAGFSPTLTNAVTLVVMLIGLVGVSQALLAKRQIQCACLGTVFNLPMSKVTFIEDGLMALMAGASFLLGH